MMGLKQENIDDSDKELLLQYCKTQDKVIIGELYSRYGHLVFGSSFKYLKNKEDAEDVVMDIFTNLGSKILKYEISYFKSWLYMLTRNECLNRLKKTNQEVALSEHQILTDGNLLALENKEMQEIALTELEKAIITLTPPQDEAIRLFYIEELSYKEVSERLKISLNKVKSAIQNGKRNLKIKLMQNDLFKSA